MDSTERRGSALCCHIYLFFFFGVACFLETAKLYSDVAFPTCAYIVSFKSLLSGPSEQIMQGRSIPPFWYLC